MDGQARPYGDAKIGDLGAAAFGQAVGFPHRVTTVADYWHEFQKAQPIFRLFVDDVGLSFFRSSFVEEQEDRRCPKRPIPTSMKKRL